MTRTGWQYALAVALIGALYAWRADGVRQGRALERAAAAHREGARLRDTIRVVETRYRRDTVRLTRTLRVWDSVRVRDTLAVTVPGDSVVVYVPRAVADTAVSACLAVVRSCDVRVALRDTLIGTLRAELRAAHAARPSVVQRWGERVLWLGVGVGVGAVVRR